MKLTKLVAVGLLVLPLATFANPEAAQAKRHYISTPKALRGHYHGNLTVYWDYRGKPFYGGSTYVITKKHLTWGALQSDTYPDRVTKVHKYKVVKIKQGSARIYRFRAEECMGKHKLYTQYIVLYKVKGEKLIALGNTKNQLLKRIKHLDKYAYVKGTVPGIGNNYD